MASLLADEHFPRPVVRRLRALGHDLVTAQDAGLAGIADDDVLAVALAVRIHAALEANPDLMGLLIRVYRPNSPPTKVP